MRGFNELVDLLLFLCAGSHCQPRNHRAHNNFRELCPPRFPSSAAAGSLFRTCNFHILCRAAPVAARRRRRPQKRARIRPLRVRVYPTYFRRRTDRSAHPPSAIVATPLFLACRRSRARSNVNVGRITDHFSVRITAALNGSVRFNRALCASVFCLFRVIRGIHFDSEDVG